MKKQTIHCDRCGNEIDRHGILEEKISVIIINNVPKELCEECFEDFREFMDEKDDSEDDY